MSEKNKNPNSLAQLDKGHPFKKGDGRASLAGKRSAEVRAAKKEEKKRILEWVEYFGNKEIEVTNPDGTKEKVVTFAAVGQSLVRKAAKGDLRAIELVLKLNGELEENINIAVTKPQIVFEDGE